MHERPRATAAVGSMLDDAIKLYRASLPRCLPLALIGALLSAVVGAYATLRTQSLGGGTTSLADLVAHAPELAAQLASIVRSPGAWCSFIGASFISLAFHGALIARQNAVAMGLVDSLGAVLALTLRRLPSIVLALFMFALAAALASLALRIAAIAGIMAALAIGGLLLIAGTWLSGRLLLWLVAMFTEDVGAWAALASSWRLIEGNWWQASTTLTIAYIIIILISLVAQGVGSAIGAANANKATALILAQAPSLIASVFTLPMSPAMMLAIYQDLWRVKQRC